MRAASYAHATEGVAREAVNRLAESLLSNRARDGPSAGISLGILDLECYNRKATVCALRIAERILP